mmetsp:Transcript_30574/g.68693  ORF Transcript_30574/g.68693 Transcript_30574/m.68693 type:complete len:379 (+) Transcript_30574:39-1175(+)
MLLRHVLANAVIILLTASQETCPQGSASCAASDGGSAPGRPDGVCFAVIATEKHAKELAVRVPHILKHQNFDFSLRYIVLDTDGEKPKQDLSDSAQELVSKGVLDNWLVVDYSRKFIKRMNKTANWDPYEHRPQPGHEARHKTLSFSEFNEDWEEKERPVHYFAIDQCKYSHLVMMQIELVWMSYRKYSWITAGLELFKANPGLVLVQPPFPGVEYRRMREKPVTKDIEKIHTRIQSSKIEVEETTCRHPWSLAAWASLLDLDRYDDVSPRQDFREHRCGGQLVKGKRCKDYEYIRGCGGMRLWEDALECVICNRKDLRQAQLSDSDRVWVQKAPITCFRSDVEDMIEGLQMVENGTVFPVSGMDFTLKLEEDEESDI